MAALRGRRSRGEPIFLVMRGVNCSAEATYDSAGAQQQGSRDAEIDAAADACP